MIDMLWVHGSRFTLFLSFVCDGPGDEKKLHCSLGTSNGTGLI